MSLDDTHRELIRFRQELSQFHDFVRGSVRSLERSHSAVDGLWRDSFRKDYDRRWAEFGKHMSSFLDRDAVKYTKFIGDRIQRVQRYLHG